MTALTPLPETPADYWLMTASERDWAASPSEQVCGAVYGGQFWSPKPCIKAASHQRGTGATAFCADAYGRTWTSGWCPVPDDTERETRDA